MEKIAVIEIKTTSVQLKLIDMVTNKYYQPSRTIEMPINLIKDFYTDMFIKPTVVKEINDILKVYKQIIDSSECIETICIASDILTEAKNQNGVLNELLVVNGFRFQVMNEEERVNAVYTSVINSFNKPKGVIIDVEDYNTQVIVYNRRNILGTASIPYGSVSLLEANTDKTFEDRETLVASKVNEIFEESGIVDTLPEEYEIIGVGDVFKDFGVVS